MIRTEAFVVQGAASGIKPGAAANYIIRDEARRRRQRSVSRIRTMRRRMRPLSFTRENGSLRRTGRGEITA